MTNTHGSATLGDIIEPTEEAIPDHHEHGKAAPRPDDDAGQRRAEAERQALGIDDSSHDESPSE